MIQSEQQVLEQILKRPDAKVVMKKANDILEQEQRKREKFYNDITEQQKAEFINGEIVIHSPVKKLHNEGGGLLFHLLDIYVRKHQLGFVGIEKIKRHHISIGIWKSQNRNVHSQNKIHLQFPTKSKNF